VAFINGPDAAPFLVVIMLIARRPAEMGRYCNGWLANMLGWVTVVLMTGAAIASIATGG